MTERSKEKQHGCLKNSVQEGKPQGIPKGQLNGDALEGFTLKPQVERRVCESKL